MVFNEEKVTTLGAQTKRGLQSLGYTSSDDTITEVSADGYFNEYKEYITKGDIITFVDATNLLQHVLRVKTVPLSGDVITEVVSTYTDFDNIDGGFANSVYLVSQTINGGGA